MATTYGVGDLSAINGIAGAYAENVPLIHISGIPPLHAVQKGTLIHHTLVDGNYDNIMNCMKEFTVAQTRLTPANAAFEIDRVLRQCFLEAVLCTFNYQAILLTLRLKYLNVRLT